MLTHIGNHCRGRAAEPTNAEIATRLRSLASRERHNARFCEPSSPPAAELLHSQADLLVLAAERLTGDAP